jgi:outer membrane protein TolC
MTAEGRRGWLQRSCVEATRRWRGIRRAVAVDVDVDVTRVTAAASASCALPCAEHPRQRPRQDSWSRKRARMRACRPDWAIRAHVSRHSLCGRTQNVSATHCVRVVAREELETVGGTAPEQPAHMSVRTSIFALLFSVGAYAAFAQQPDSADARRLTLRDAVDLALARNHAVRLARLSVDDKNRAKEVARSGYFPFVRNDTTIVHLTDTQLVEIPAGGLGVVGANPIPAQALILNQGGVSTVTNGTGLVQPLTQLLRVKAANDIARADVDATREQARGIEDTTALLVHQIYYRLLIADVRRRAAIARIQAFEDVQRERIVQVKFGSALEADLIESRAHALQARQELLTTDLQRADLQTQLNDVIGLPLTTALQLEPNVSPPAERCQRDACIRLALESQPAISEARAEVEKAAAAVRLAKYDIVPDVEAFVRYSFQNNVPFLAGRFGTVGIRASVDLFDGGRKRAVVRERETQLAQAKENLARISDEVELRVQTAYNKMERTRQMVAVSEELLALRGESRRVAAELLANGGTLGSQAKESAAQELDAQAALLQSQLDYVQAADEMDAAIGRRPR